ncbi:hypothetical protein [Methylorubrum extorquens]
MDVTNTHPFQETFSMPSHCENLAAALRDPLSPLGAAVQAMRDMGMPLQVAVHDQTTGQVYVADDNGHLEVAHGAIREMVTGEPWRDPGTINPVAPTAVRWSPKRLAAHNAEVSSMLLYIIGIYEPLLAADPETKDAIADFIPLLGTPSNRRKLVGLSDNYERWDVIAGNFIKLMDEMNKTSATPH